MLQRVWLLLFAMAFAAGLTDVVPAQPPPPAAIPVDGGTPAKEPAEPEVDRHYIPASELQALLTKYPEGVVLARDEFESLWRLAQELLKQTADEPRGLVVSTADLEGRIDGDRLRLHARVRYRQFAEGWRSVRLPVDGLHVHRVQLDGEAAAAFPEEGNGTSTGVVVLSPGRGRHELQLELSAPLTPVGSDRSVDFGVLGAPSGTLLLELPAGKSLKANGLVVPAGEDVGAGIHRIRLPIGGQRRIALTIGDRGQSQFADALVFARTEYRVHVAPGEMNWDTETAVSVFGRTLGQMVFTVPEELEVTRVESLGLQMWEVGPASERGRSALTLSYRHPFDGERKVRIEGILAAESEQWTVPRLVLEGADSHAARIRVTHDAGLRLQATHDASVRAHSESDSPQSRDDGPATGAETGAETRAETGAETMDFTAVGSEFELSLLAVPRARSVQAAMTNLLSLGDDGIDLLVTVDVDTSFLPLFEFLVRIPAEFEVRSLTSGEEAVTWAVTNGQTGASEIRVGLVPPLMPGDVRRITLTAHTDSEDWPVEIAPVLLSLPEVRLPQADMLEARYGVASDPDLDVETVELSGLDPAQPSDLQSLNDAARALGRALRLAFSYPGTEFSGQLEIRRRPVKFFVATNSLTRIEAERSVTLLRSYVHADGGGLEGVLIQLPEAVDRDSRFDVTRVLPGDVASEGAVLRSRPGEGPWANDAPVTIVEHTVSEPVEGRRTWGLRFDRRWRGEIELTAVLTQPRTGGADVGVPEPVFVGAERQDGWIAVEGTSQQRLVVTAVDAAGAPLRDVDSIDVPDVLPVGAGEPLSGRRRRIVAGYRSVRAGARVTIAEQRFERQSVPTALGDEFRIDSLLGPTGEWQHRLHVAFRAVGVQNLRMTLPEASTLWSVMVDGHPVQVRRTGDAFQIPLSDVSSSRTDAGAHSLEVFYRSQTDRLDVAGTLQTEVPTLAVWQGAGAVRPLEVLQREWTLQSPADMVLLESRGLFQPRSPLDDETLLGRVRRGMALPTLNEAAIRAGLAAVGCLLIWMVSRLFRRHPLLTVIGLLVAAPLMAGVAGLILVRGFGLSAPDRSGGASTGAVATPAVPSLGFDSYSFAVPELESMDEVPLDKLSRSELAAEEAVQQSAEPLMAQDADLDLGEPVADVPAGPAAQKAARPSEGAEAGADRAKDFRGLLSLSLELEAPRGMRTTTFHSLSRPEEDNVAALELSFASRSFRLVIQWIAAVATAGLYWGLRDGSARARSLLMLLTLLVPVGVAPVVPPLWSMFVEGLVAGGCLGLGLWLLRGVVRGLIRWRAALSRAVLPSSTVSAGAVLILGGVLHEAGASAAEPVTAGRPKVYIPYTGDDPLAAEKVFLPHAVYRSLWEAAHREERRPDTPDAVVADAEYVVDIRGAAAEARSSRTALEVKGRLIIRSFREGPVGVRLPFRGVALRTARLNGEPAAVRQVDRVGAEPLRGSRRPAYAASPNNRAEMTELELVVPRAGVHVVDVTWDVAAVLQETSGEFSLPLEPVAAARLRLVLPLQRDLQVRAGRVRGARPPDEGSPRPDESLPEGDRAESEGVLEYAVDRGGDITVAWQPKARISEGTEIVQAESITVLEAGDDGVRLRLSVTFQVRQGSITQIPFHLPEELRLTRVQGGDIGGWEIRDEASTRELLVFFRRAVDDETQMLVELFLPLDGDPMAATIDLPEFAPRQVTRETGQIVLLAGDHLLVRVRQADGVTQTTAFTGTLNETLNPEALPVRATYRFAARPVQLSLDLSPRPAEMRVVSEHGVYVTHRRLQLVSHFEVQLMGVPRRLLRTALPQDFLMVELSGTHVEDWWVDEGDLVVDLGAPQLGGVQFAMEGHVPRDPAEREAVIETPLPLGVDRQESRLGVWVDDSLTATVEAFEGWRVVDPGAFAGRLRELRSEPMQFALQSALPEPEVVLLGIAVASPHLSADAVTLIAAGESSIDYGLTLQWTIERAATSEFLFTTPGWLLDRLTLTGEGVQRIRKTVLDDGRVRWQVSVAEPVDQQFLLSGVAVLPPPETRPLDGGAGATAAGSFAAPEIRFESATGEPGEFVELDTQQSFAILANLSSLQVSGTPGETHSRIQPDELPFVIRNEVLTRAMELVRLTPGVATTWQMQRVLEQRTAAAQVTGSDLTTVVADDGSWRTRAEYRVRNRGQQFLAVHLPEGGRLLSVLVRDEPVEVLTTSLGARLIRLIPLPQTSAADLSFPVVMVLDGRLPRSLARDIPRLRDEVSIPAPTVVTPAQSPEFGVPVVSTNWNVHLPDYLDAVLLRNRGRSNVTFLPEGRSELMAEVQLLQELAELTRMIGDSRVSQSQRKLARYNVGKLEKSLSLADAYSGMLRRGDEEDFRSVPEELRQLAEQRKEILLEATRNAEWFDQELERQQHVQGQRDGDAAQSLPLPSADDTLNFVLEGNDAIILDNRVVQPNANGVQGGFRFFRSPSSAGGAATSDAKTPSRARLSERLAQQAPLTDIERAQQSQVPADPHRFGGEIANMWSGLRGGGGGIPSGTTRTAPEAAGLQPPFAAGVPEGALSVPAAVAAALSESADVAGGLSLPIELPTAGTVYHFTKLGGDPQLTLSLRSRETVMGGVRWLWTVAWLGGAVCLLPLVWGGPAAGSWTRLVAAGAVTAGLFALFCLPSPGAWAAVPVIMLGTAGSLWTGGFRRGTRRAGSRS
jgi:hypothetical protein